MQKKPSLALAIVGLIINIFLLPGLGSLIGGKITAGLVQLILLIFGIPLSFIFIGIPLVIASWIWALITGVQMVQEAEHAHKTR